ncbi:MAG TPA: pyruvate dehydrogenase complex dihydrolipoamide acetyltransferase [Pyrinomonadaceae bacterium]|nr:pyruvate dehydrogenase complex dihydrolipoamide acetyltransferase [Pyrinomonadaceae bacterium]
MPKLSPTMEEGQIARWLKKEGDKVSMGEPLAEIDTDKATMEMQALANGVLRKILVGEGESAPLGQLIGVIGEADEDISSLLSEAPAKGAAASTPKPEPAAASKPQETTEPQLAETPAEQPAPAPSGNGAGGRLIVSPLAARMAAEAGIDLRSLRGSGPGGRIIKKDIETAMSQQQPSAAAGKQPVLRVVEGRQQQPIVVGASTYHDEPASEIRRTIARRLVTSLGPVPHFFLTSEIEMDRAAEMRRGINALDPDLKISINDVIIKVTAAALMQHRQVNASFQDKVVRYYDHADIGVAVAIEDGLITPVIRSADQKSLSQIAAEVRELAERARSKRLKPEEYTGATFSVSNLGMFGINEFTAIINPPEGGILAIGAMTPQPVARDGEMVVRQMMRVTMSCDHRLIDGATGAKFLQTFKKMLENPLYLVV